MDRMIKEQLAESTTTEESNSNFWSLFVLLPKTGNNFCVVLYYPSFNYRYHRCLAIAIGAYGTSIETNYLWQIQN